MLWIFVIGTLSGNPDVQKMQEVTERQCRVLIERFVEVTAYCISPEGTIFTASDFKRLDEAVAAERARREAEAAAKAAAIAADKDKRDAHTRELFKGCCQ